MNKYEKSYNSIMKLLSVEQLATIVKSHSIYKELVERATPKKVIYDIDGDEICPICKNRAFENWKPNHCYECGQALLWDNQQNSNE